MAMVMMPLVVMASESSSSTWLPSPSDVYIYDSSSDSSESSSSVVPDSSSVDSSISNGEPLMIMPFAVTGTAYSGAISDSILDYFRGIMAHNPGTPYVVFRSDQYNYYIFYGDDLRVNGTTFTGSGQYVRYYAYNGTVYRGTDTINMTAGNGFVYSNMSDLFPAFYEERGLLIEKILLFSLIVLFCFLVFTLFLFRKR